ncbi:MAG: sulfite exporter TauE/SafE family protein [Planctomycetota bacterium]|jgi:uncharacterized membrane protein YfcA
MSNQPITTKFQRAVAAVSGAVICLVIIMGMFHNPARERSPISFPQNTQAQPAAKDPVFHFTAENVFGLFVIGLCSGTFSGMFGMGGGVLKMSFLLFFGFHPGVSKFAALLAYFVVAAGSTYRYLKFKFVMLDVVKILIHSGIAGIIFGAFVGHYLPRDVMALLLGLFLLFVSVVMVRRILTHYEGVMLSVSCSAEEREYASKTSCDHPAPDTTGWKIALCGYPGGFLSAMLGISGGVVTNPLQQVLAHIPIKNAIANTLAKASITAPIACLIIMIMGIRGGHFDLWTPIMVALCLIPGSVIGSQLGPGLTKRMSSAMTHALFGAVALFMGINMLFFSK